MSAVAFWTGSSDGSSWYRADQPAAALGWRAHRTWVSELLPASVIARSDVIVGSRIATPEATEVWGQLKAAGKRLVLDLDDDYFHVEERNRNAAATWNDKAMQWRLVQNMCASDVVTVASQALGEVVYERLVTLMGVSRMPTIEVIENGLHAGHLSVPRDYDPAIITIGWAGTMATSHDLDLALPALVKILDYTRPTGTIHLSMVGLPRDHPARFDLEVAARGRARAVEWAWPVEAYHGHVRRFDIWVAPYRANEFTEAKFPTKALEAGMMGIPLIASDIRPYREWITPGVNGFLVHPDRPWEWSKYLKMLVDDAGLRRRMGEAARSRASSNILQTIGGQWEQVLFG